MSGVNFISLLIPVGLEAFLLVVNMQLTSSIWEDFQYLPNSSKMWLRILSIALEEELKFLDFV